MRLRTHEDAGRLGADPENAPLIMGTDESRARARAEVREARRLDTARRSAWPDLDVSDLRFGRLHVEHEPSGDLYLPMRGELSGERDRSVAAYYVLAGEAHFLQRPQRGFPQTRAELDARRSRKRQA